MSCVWICSNSIHNNNSKGYGCLLIYTVSSQDNDLNARNMNLVNKDDKKNRR
jgi:hypothetical protein